MNSFVKILRSEFFNKYGMLIILGLLVLFMGGMSSGRFFRPQNLLNILEQVTPIGIIAIGVTFVIITGGIDLSLGSVIA
ncbi:MAG: ribose ABC transporter permease, partial [Spirochaetota bacterium]